MGGINYDCLRFYNDSWRLRAEISSTLISQIQQIFLFNLNGNINDNINHNICGNL